MSVQITQEHWIAVCKRVVKNHQNEKYEGQIVDAFTASAVVQVAKKLEGTKFSQDFLSRDFHKAITIVWKLVK